MHVIRNDPRLPKRLDEQRNGTGEDDVEVREKKYTVNRLVEALNSGALLRNEEYQRGAAWSELQKAAFVDSLFRRYPVPALFLHEVQSVGLADAPSVKHEIVDGQQRLNALRDFLAGRYALFEVSERSRLRIPQSVRAKPAPWAGKRYTELALELKRQLEDAEITVFILGPDSLRDEVRDLFIRLQSGTALSRQQIRDAWPGNLGPFVESLAGKLTRTPSVELFRLIDRRGTRSEEEDQKDEYVTDRQICAQLLRVFLARQRDPYAYPSVSANELDALYHEFTDFDVDGETARRFKELLALTAAVVQWINTKKPGRKNKMKRLDVLSIFMFLDDLLRTRLRKGGPADVEKLAQRVVDTDGLNKPIGKSTSGTALQKYYEWWRENVGKDFGILLDSRRVFDDAQKRGIWQRDRGICGVCGKAVSEDTAEYDHFPVPYRDGGPTEVDNGRLVHAGCHERGRQSSE
jgi:hypothetical protein